MYKRQHIRRRHGDKRHCQVCQQPFSSEFSLQRHQRNTHQNGFNCSECHELFSSNFDLGKHMVVHQDIKKGLFNAHMHEIQILGGKQSYPEKSDESDDNPMPEGLLNANLGEMHTLKESKSNAENSNENYVNPISECTEQEEYNIDMENSIPAVTFEYDTNDQPPGEENHKCNKSEEMDILKEEIYILKLRMKELESLVLNKYKGTVYSGKSLKKATKRGACKVKLKQQCQSIKKIFTMKMRQLLLMKQ